MLNDSEKKEYAQLMRECMKNGAVREGIPAEKLDRLKALAEKAKQPEAQPGSAPANEPQAEPKKKETILSKVKLDDIGKLPLEKLKEICRQEHLPADANVDILRKIVRAKKLGGDRQVINNNTLCKYCKYPARIINSEIVKVFADKSRVVYYRLTCSGPRPHKFSVKQSEKAQQNEKK
jgi:hypothetical protein